MTAGRASLQLTQKELAGTPDVVLSVMDNVVAEAIRMARQNSTLALFYDLTILHDTIRDEMRDRWATAEMLRADAPWNQEIA